jgi:hypothetical protein
MYSLCVCGEVIAVKRRQLTMLNLRFETQTADQVWVYLLCMVGPELCAVGLGRESALL